MQNEFSNKKILQEEVIHSNELIKTINKNIKSYGLDSHYLDKYIHYWEYFYNNSKIYIRKGDLENIIDNTIKQNEILEDHLSTFESIRRILPKNLYLNISNIKINFNLPKIEYEDFVYIIKSLDNDLYLHYWNPDDFNHLIERMNNKDDGFDTLTQMIDFVVDNVDICGQDSIGYIFNNQENKDEVKSKVNQVINLIIYIMLKKLIKEFKNLKMTINFYILS